MDFSNQWGLDAINADEAYAHLQLSKGSNVVPGTGVTVGFIDTGIDSNHPLFRSSTISETLLTGATDELGGDSSHGTAVASIVGADPIHLALTDRGKGFQGIAWGAALKMFAIPLGDPVPRNRVYAPRSLNGLSQKDGDYAQIFNTVLAQDMDILNLSFATSGLIENYDAQGIRSNLGQTINALAQAGVQEKTILVWAASNDHDRACTPRADNCVGSDRTDDTGNPAGSLNASSVGILAGLVARITELQGHSIAAVAVDNNGNIADFSNRCGIAKDWCIAAPGVSVKVAYFGPQSGIPGKRGIGTSSGTSLAAPMVAGGLALMKQQFRGQLSNTAIVSRLFATARKEGKYANAAIYGQGMMDLGAATAPMGQTTVSLGPTVDDAGVDLRMTSLGLGGALGDGLGRSLAGQEIAAFDSLGAPFWFKLSGFTGATRGPSSLVRLRELTAQSPVTRRAAGRLMTFTPARAGGSVEQDFGYGMLRFGYRERPAGPEGGHFMLADNATTLTFTGSNGMSLSTFTASGLAGRSPTSGIALAWRPFDVPVGFRAGWLAEQATLLGTMATGAFGQLSADAAVTGIETSFEIGRWHLAADAEIGKAHPQVRGGIITRMSSLTTSAFAFNATRRLANGGLMRIVLSQPLRVEGGRAALSVPVGRTRDGAVLRQPVSASVAPSGRQFDVSASWHHPFTDGNELRLNATWTHNPGHNVYAKPAWGLLAGWQFEF
ncbi:MAG: S8 family serine peptidase [Nitrospira sp.]|nr:S8 family serine peptidase [Nitrospira sp.]